MKIKAKDEYAQQKLRDWKVWYIADQLGVGNSDASQLVDGKTIEVKPSKITDCSRAIAVHLIEVKASKPKGSKK